MTQNEHLRNHLNEGRQIDQLTALKNYGIMRLASRIHELREDGMDIVGCMASDPCGRKYAIYWLAAPALRNAKS